jgi:DNA-binding MarR family transcriptional regulator
MDFPTFFSDNDIKKLDELHHLMLGSSFEKNSEDKFPHLKGLSTTEIGTLRILIEHPDSMITDIGGILGVSKSTMTGIIDHLEKRGYIRRLISLKDRRSFALELTDDGKLAQKEHIEYETYVYSHILSSLGTRENVDEFLGLMELVCKYF